MHACIGIRLPSFLSRELSLNHPCSISWNFLGFSLSRILETVLFRQLSFQYPVFLFFHCSSFLSYCFLFHFVRFSFYRFVHLLLSFIFIFVISFYFTSHFSFQPQTFNITWFPLYSWYFSLLSQGTAAQVGAAVMQNSTRRSAKEGWLVCWLDSEHNFSRFWRCTGVSRQLLIYIFACLG
ncbi:hypothetical protein L228DRAFT_128911 [Xylona heveae TC161]|uniref:Uncharacterized protein n=1 Tax=Xylona heveae (strain CBS 132557 / TC161) TaxID=1328760 RepID=A0A165GTJ7_XYLHT|nr:hypothetical protein L228DRAFT_128911 [Xylona heveae TC161]KZF22580.1 hypothetical protein L228DRAFT_128911 [Xylona heveae TC161]